MEWAELKREELRAIVIEQEDLSTTSKDSGSSSSPNSIRREATNKQQSGKNGRDNPHGALQHTIDHEMLLQTWLAETGHIDDKWAEKLLGSEGNSGET